MFDIGQQMSFKRMLLWAAVEKQTHMRKHSLRQCTSFSARCQRGELVHIIVANHEGVIKDWGNDIVDRMVAHGDVDDGLPIRKPVLERCSLNDIHR